MQSGRGKQQSEGEWRVARNGKRFVRACGRGEKGSTLVEFALVFMLLMTMMLGIVNFGRALYAYHFVSNAARSATRWAAVNGNTCTNDGSCTAPISCGSGTCTPCTSG